MHRDFSNDSTWTRRIKEKYCYIKHDVEEEEEEEEEGFEEIENRS